MKLEHIDPNQVFSAAHASLGAARHMLNGHGRLHDHAFMELAVVLVGEGAHISSAGDQTLKRGDAFFLRHSPSHADTQRLNLEVFNVDLGEDILVRELAWTIHPLRWTPRERHKPHGTRHRVCLVRAQLVQARLVRAPLAHPRLRIPAMSPDDARWRTWPSP